MGCKSMTKQGLLVALAGFVVLAGCGGENDFNYGKVRGIIEGTPMRLDAEYVILSPQQVECGVQNDLWDSPSTLGRERSVAHLTDKARELKFADDVSLGELRQPYAQIRGDITLFVNEILDDKAGPEPGTKLVDARISAVIQHSCFPAPLPIMGVKKGNFTQDYPPVLFFRYNNGWQLEKFVH
jgi:hypothetical protein